MAKKKSVWGDTIVGVPGKLQFPVIAAPGPNPFNSDLSYSAQLICSPSPALHKLLAEVVKVQQAAFAAGAAVRLPWESGEELLARLAADGKEFTESTVSLYKGRTILRLKARGDKEAPKAYVGKELAPRRAGNESDLKAIADQFYAGALVRVSASPFSYAMSGAVQGVSLLFKAIQFVRDHDRIGSVNLDAAMQEDFTDEGFEGFEEEPFASDSSADGDDIPF